jgi:hypothetical protein
MMRIGHKALILATLICLLGSAVSVAAGGFCIDLNSGATRWC